MFERLRVRRAERVVEGHDDAGLVRRGEQPHVVEFERRSLAAAAEAEGEGAGRLPVSSGRYQDVAFMVMELLEGEDLLMARGRLANDPEFAREVHAWEERLAPLLDEVSPVMPSADLWQRIDARVNAQAPRRTVGRF